MKIWSKLKFDRVFMPKTRLSGTLICTRNRVVVPLKTVALLFFTSILTAKTVVRYVRRLNEKSKCVRHFYCCWFSGARLLVRSSHVLLHSSSLWTTVQPAPHLTTLVTILRWRFVKSEWKTHHTHAYAFKRTTALPTLFFISHTLTGAEPGAQTRGKRHQMHTQL